MVEYNTIIIGAGISGISCAIYLKRAGLSTLLIESNMPGGQLNRIGVIENYPGYVSITGVDLAMNLLDQVNAYQVDYEYGEIREIDYEKQEILVGEKKYHYQYLVFATGRRERKLELAHEEELIGKGISFCATCDGALYKNQDVIVVGGGSSAVSEAIYLANICRKVILIYRKNELRAENVLRKRLSCLDNVEIRYDTTVDSYLVQNEKLVGVRLNNGEELKVSCVFLAIGQLPNSELFDGEKQNGYIVVNSHYETSRDGVYACGDVIKKDLYQLITASSEGSMVASEIIKKN